VTSQSPDSTETKFQNTLVHTIVHSDLPPAEKTFLRIRQEVGTVTGAGFETTANALRLILYHVYTNPTILHRLRQELRNIPSSTTPALKTLEQLPYLTAVLTEGMRLSPAIGTRAARITDKDLFYRDWRIPAGTPVGMTTLLMHVDPELFPDPMRFDPERWLGAQGPRNKKWFAPFGRGTRICLGMQYVFCSNCQLPTPRCLSALKKLTWK
jgi:cytochrome P450